MHSWDSAAQPYSENSFDHVTGSSKIANEKLRLKKQID